MAQRICLHLQQVSVQRHLVKLEIANIQFLASSTLEKIYCEKCIDSGDILKVEQQQLPVDWMWDVRMKSTVSRFIYKCVIQLFKKIVCCEI